MKGGLEDNEFREIMRPSILSMNGDQVKLIGSGWSGNREMLNCVRVMRSQFFTRFHLASKVIVVAFLTTILFESG